MELRLRNGKGQVPASTSYHAAMVAANEDSGSESTEPATRALQGRGKRRKRGRQLVKFREGGKRSRYNLRSPFEPGSKPSSSVVFHRRNSSLDSDRSTSFSRRPPRRRRSSARAQLPGPQAVSTNSRPGRRRPSLAKSRGTICKRIPAALWSPPRTCWSSGRLMTGWWRFETATARF